MRPIDPQQVRAELSTAWLDRAAAERSSLETDFTTIYPTGYTLEKELRKRLSDAVESRGAATWRHDELRKALMKVSHGKCWYCEAQVAERADNAIDHFRPKNRVAENPGHPGYWWLAYSWENYRFACTFCNSIRSSEGSSGRGKQDHFKLWDETKRAKTPKDRLRSEQPLLLDPLQPDDVQNLTFDRDGTAVPSCSKEEDPYLYEWACESIERYHLNRKWIKDKRRDLLLAVEQELKVADDWYQQRQESQDARQAWRDSLSRLRGYLRRSAEFSGAARAFVGSQRGTSKTAESLLNMPEW